MWESCPAWESLSSVVVVEEPLASSDELLLLDLELAAAVLSWSRCDPPISKRSLLRAWLPGVFALLGCFLWVGPPLPLVWWSPVLMRALPHSSDRLVRWAAALTLSFLVPYTVS